VPSDNAEEINEKRISKEKAKRFLQRFDFAKLFNRKKPHEVNSPTYRKLPESSQNRSLSHENINAMKLPSD